MMEETRVHGGRRGVSASAANGPGRTRRATRVVLALLLIGAAAPPAHASVVSLGDSYSPGEGSRDKQSPAWDKGTGDSRGGNGCHRSWNAWPHLLGATPGRNFACLGETIPDVIARGQKRRAPDNVSQPERLGSLDPRVEIDTVLLTLGGRGLSRLHADEITGEWLARAPAGSTARPAMPATALMRKSVVLVSASGRAARRCNGVGGTAVGQGGFEFEWGAFNVRAHGIRCARARRHIRTCIATGRSPRGWRFNRSQSGWVLSRRETKVIWQPAGGGSGCADGGAWRHCGSVTFEPNTEFGASNIRARGTRCRKARRVAQASREMNVVDGPFHYEARGFRCTGVPIDQALPAVRWTCRRGAARVKFTRT